MTSLVFVNRAGRISGAEVVLLRLVDVAVRQGHRVRVVSPRGPLADRLPAVVEHLPIEELDLGGRAGLRRIVAYGALARRSLRAAFVIRRAAAGDAVVVASGLKFAEGPLYRPDGTLARRATYSVDVLNGRSEEFAADGTTVIATGEYRGDRQDRIGDAVIRRRLR